MDVQRKRDTKSKRAAGCQKTPKKMEREKKLSDRTAEQKRGKTERRN